MSYIPDQAYLSVGSEITQGKKIGNPNIQNLNQNQIITNIYEYVYI